MQIKLTGHHVDITDALRDYTHSKMERLQRHFDNVVDIHVVFTVQKLEQRAEATVHIGGATLHADCAHNDMYAAIDGMTDKLDRQLLKHKEKRTDHHRSEGAIHNALADE